MHNTSGPFVDDIQTGRRSFLRRAALGVAAGTMMTSMQASSAEPAVENRPAVRAFNSSHTLKPLPYKTSALRGLSARLIESHWSNNYGGSVRALNAVNQTLKLALDDKSTPAFVYNGLKREHLMRTGSVLLHELYFDNLGGAGKAGANMRSRISASFGEFATWETEFRRIAAGLGGGSGWVMLGYNTHFGALENYWMADHMHAPASTIPLLVLDMYEHSYQMDYGSAAAKYVDAFFNNINWDVIAQRSDTAAAQSALG